MTGMDNPNMRNFSSNLLDFEQFGTVNIERNKCLNTFELLKFYKNSL